MKVGIAVMLNLEEISGHSSTSTLAKAMPFSAVFW